MQARGYLLSFIVFITIFTYGIAENKHAEDPTLKLVQDALQDATNQYDEMMRRAMASGAQSRRHSREAVKSTKETQEIGRISDIFRAAFENLTKRNDLSRESIETHLQELLPKTCQHPQISCDSKAKYRSLNGTCNNVDNPYWGAKNASSLRELEPVYENGDEPRGGLKSKLPSARNVSLLVHIGKGEAYENMATHMVAQFGQFLDHDITLTPVQNLACCGKNNPPAECWPLDIHAEDSHYQEHNITCLDFTRSTPSCPTPAYRREQFNAITAFIDGSVVYGSDSITLEILRNGSGKGELTENKDSPGILPWRAEVISTPPTAADKVTVIAGDVRANEMPGLTVLHSLFLREHNRIAREFVKLRSDWDDEKIFQETRRIIGAELQQITYSEFLPAILGPSAMKEYGLELPAEPTAHTKYDPTVDATIFNSFATAAYRFGHTLVNGLIQMFMDNKNIVSSYNVRDNYSNSSQIVDVRINGLTGFDLILNGLVRQRAQAYDGEIHTDMTNHLFHSATFIGTDLAARNIQRGRDHGLPSYDAFRKHCKLPGLPTSWTPEEIPAEFSETSWRKLQNAGYSSPQEIDLYTGGLSEIPVGGTLSGPTFICLQAIQFERLMKGDRFFFTHENVAGAFSRDQLAALRGLSLGDIICQNSDIKETQENVFYFESSLNPIVPCSSPTRNLNIELFADIQQQTTTPTTAPTPTTTENQKSGANQITFTIFSVVFIFSLCSLAV